MPIAYDPRYGGLPSLPSTGALSGNMQSILNSAIPGFNGLTKSASSIVGSALNGELPGDVQSLIKRNAAEQAVAGGMPGTGNTNGTLFGNNTLRDLGLTSLNRQDTGVHDLLSLLQGYSGTVAPTFGQAQEQGNAMAQYAAAPIPSAQAEETRKIYDRYSNPGGGWKSGGNSIASISPYFTSIGGVTRQ